MRNYHNREIFLFYAWDNIIFIVRRINSWEFREFEVKELLEENFYLKAAGNL